jgi:hypothetical protein
LWLERWAYRKVDRKVASSEWMVGKQEVEPGER